MKIVFLDIDGVLNNDSFSAADWRDRNPGKKYDPYHCFNQENVDQFNRLIRETGAKVVVSSTWRLGPMMPTKMTPSRLQRVLRDNGNVSCEVIDFTPHILPSRMSSMTPRWKEIGQYLNDMTHRDVTFVVLDDLQDAWFGHSFINTNPRVGLTEKDVDRAIRLLNGTDGELSGG